MVNACDLVLKYGTTVHTLRAGICTYCFLNSFGVIFIDDEITAKRAAGIEFNTVFGSVAKC